MWGGMFESGPDELFKRFNDSLRFDCALLPFDVQGSVAWAKALHGAGVLTKDELLSGFNLWSVLRRLYDR